MLKAIKKGFKETDKLFLMLCLLLSAIGTIMVASATKRTVEDGDLISRDAFVMILALALGFIICMVISFIDYDLILKLWPVVAAGSLLLMFLLFTPLGTAPEARESARSWLKLTSGLYLQPSEILKIGFIVTFSYHLSKVKNDLSGLKTVLLLCVHAAIPIVLVVVTGDMGSALIFVLMFIGMLFVSGVHWLYFPAGAVAVAAVSPIVWYKVFDDIQRNRILALIHPEDYPKEIYQQQQALNAMKEGGFSGAGLFKGAFTQSGSIPMSENDMIFSVICEELGFIGAVGLLALFVLLAVRIVYVAKRSNDYAASMMCYGVLFMLIAQVVINVGMCTMLLPVIGITLPFVSAGGSSVICLYLAVGIVLSVYRSSQGIGYDDYRYNRIAKQYGN
ncbi:MAG: FtsW/RodA/SpoVE family cell cycle protein [Faecalibacterium sp.]|nr:FtsW/RodA/SpoVE family cell cycle protein [Ruminococcus sp.]MCM1392871.1 FtsW/RodA/SpoVE family cell cycle protein [Ruminococcus sp.]MCM1485839.1 FtsW/RodA/SpoVE family cell cycle protein [Faecalibacterium sp.]